jgi:hypothetical protein
MLAAQNCSDLGAHATKDKTLGVDKVPLALDFTCFWRISTHQIYFRKLKNLAAETD